MNKSAKVVTTLILLGLITQPLSALTITSAQQAGVDVALVATDVAFTTQEEVVLVPIFPPSDEFDLSASDWYRGLYYYLIGSTARPGFTDIPFHYIVTEQGQVFQGNQGKDERRIVMEGVSENAVVVAYLAAKSEVEFDARAIESLEQLVLDICNRNAINPSKIKITGAEFVRNSQSQTVSLKGANIFGLWGNALTNLVSKLSPRYQPISKNYSLQIVSLVGPVEEVKTEQNVVYTLKVKNNGEYGIYGGTNSQILLSKTDGSKSIFYDPATWLSTSQAPLIKETESLLPGAELEFTIQAKMPVDFGEKSEDFVLTTISGFTIKEATVKLTARIARPDGIIVEVKSTDTGFLRVRSAPSGAATEISRISPGERYFQLEDAGNGWVKLKLNDGKEGWVSNQFLTYL